MDSDAANGREGKDAGGDAAGGGAGGEVKASGEHLSLKVKSQDGNEVYFKVKKTTTFSKVMNAYCKKVGADMSSVRFLFDGQRLREEQTPADLDMEDEDEIDAMVAQTGGH
jgi:small ubiquitin-related modifier